MSFVGGHPIGDGNNKSGSLGQLSQPSITAPDGPHCDVAGFRGLKSASVIGGHDKRSDNYQTGAGMIRCNIATSARSV